jgi:SAM-dependent methyltransferase
MSSAVLNKARNANPRNEVWLNVGSHYYVLPGFINLDNHIFLLLSSGLPLLRLFCLIPKESLISHFYEARRAAILQRHDCRKPLPFPNGSVDHILCSHFIHHVYPDEADNILKEFRRVLKAGATLHVIEPSLARYVKMYLETGADDAADLFLQSIEISHMRRPRFRYRLLEFLGFEGLRSRWFYDESSLMKRLAAAGFRRLDRDDSPSSSFRSDEPADNINMLLGV